MKRTGLIVAALLALYWVLAVSTSPRMGVTADEVVHLTAGYSYWQENDYRLQPENGTLAMRTAALPLLAMDLHWIEPDSPAWRVSQVNQIGAQFFHHLGNPLDRMLLAGRGAIALLGVLALWLTWRWARGLFGAHAGWFALALAVFCPALLAHGALTTSDMAITAALLAVVSAFWRLLHVVTWTRLGLTALAGGAVLLAKMSGVLAAPMLALLLVWRWTRPAPLVVQLGGASRWVRKRSAIIGLTTALALGCAAASLVLLWGGYGFRYSAFRGEPPAGTQFYFPWSQILDETALPDAWQGGVRSRLEGATTGPSPTSATQLLRWVRDHRLLPEAYLWGMAHTYKFSRSRPAFLNGEFRRTGWTEFFPWTFWLKTTLPALVLLAVGIGAAARMRGRRRWVYRAAPLLVLFAVYWAVALRTHLNIGHRHILPTYPVVYVFAGAAVLWIGARSSRLVSVGLALAFAAHAVDSSLARPFYLSYFQPLGGGQHGGWRHLVDSSFDWGQGVPDLKRWLAEREAEGDRTPVYLTYFGADIPPKQPDRVTRFADEATDTGPRAFPVRPQGGWFAISATHFQRVYLRVHGPWDDRYEDYYQQARAELNQLAAMPDRDATAEARILRVAMDFEVLEFGRLCHYLRAREPLEIVGGSILIFRLTDAEVRFALNAPLTAFPTP